MTTSQKDQANTARDERESPLAAGWRTCSLQKGDLYFTSPSVQFRANSNALAICRHSPVNSALIATMFQEARDQGIHEPLLFGLVPFDAQQAGSFTIPASYERSGVPAESPALPADASSRPRIMGRHPVPAPDQYADAVRAALDIFNAGKADKIVLSRAMDVTLDGTLDYQVVLEDLIRRNRKGYNFAIPVWDDATTQGAAVMLGASPELLVRREGSAVFINPLAGSIGRHADPQTDRERRDGLATSEKDLREHSYVVEDIVKNLAPYCDELNVPDGPSVIGTDALWHLSTYITGTLRDPATTALDLSCALHPTPAICGHPTDVAFAYINQLEAFDRGYFAGLVGWQAENGDGEWALTLRCALHAKDNRLRLYAGAGTVAGSDPDSEVTETATKMETFMRAIA